MSTRRGRAVTGARVTVAAVLAAVLASGMLIWSASDAALSGVTTTPVNSWEAGTVRMTDDDGGTALFTAENLKPGRAIVNCIRATYGGSVPAEVRLYANVVGQTPGSGGTALLPYVHVTIEESSAGAYGCGGFSGPTTTWNAATHPGAASDLLSDFPTDWAAGVPSAVASWPAASFRVYRLTLTVDGAIPDSSQSAAATVAFTWEAQA